MPPGEPRSRSHGRAALAALLFLGIACLLTWPMISMPGSGAYDSADTLFNTWLMAWNQHALAGGMDPLQTPIYLGQTDRLGRHDLLLTQAIAAAPLRVLGASPLAAHNLMMVVSLALCGMAAFLLSMTLTGSRHAALFTGVAFMALPFFQGHLWHLQLMSAGLTVLAIREGVLACTGSRRGVVSLLSIALLILLQGCAS